ncbi:MAG: glycine cleavage system aminomethyltransferase GcvT [Dehalococcoidia bacterium]
MSPPPPEQRLTQALKRTALYQTHLELKARMMPFAGWEMPIQFAGILAEARAVRGGSGIFDVSHMGRLYLSGSDATALLDWVLTASVVTLQPDRSRYTLLLNQQGGIIDDGIVYRLGEQKFLLVCNAANRPPVVSWLHQWSRERFPQVAMEDRTEETVMVALQGPETPALLESLSGNALSALRPFTCAVGEVAGKSALVGRTGYTGEDGFELIVPWQAGPPLWRALMERGAQPCGLGARDVLRLEAGLLLHGSDTDQTTTPLEAGLERFVRLEKGEFVGSSALLRQQQEGLQRRLVGFVIQGQGVARHGYPLLVQGQPVGAVTSGTYSPTLDRSIGLGYVRVEYATSGQSLQVDIRGRQVEAQVTPLPFYSRKRTS